MRRRNWLVGLAVLGGIGWYAFRPELLFVQKRVDESLPVAAAQTSAQLHTLASGTFHSVAHETKGTASILRLSDGSRILRLTQFATSNGPDVRVYIVAAPDASDNATVKRAGFVELGKLKGTEGDQNYEVPASVDLSRYRAVTIWCKRFSVNFATAPLSPTS